MPDLQTIASSPTSRTGPQRSQQTLLIPVSPTSLEAITLLKLNTCSLAIHHPFLGTTRVLPTYPHRNQPGNVTHLAYLPQRKTTTRPASRGGSEPGVRTPCRSIFVQSAKSPSWRRLTGSDMKRRIRSAPKSFSVIFATQSTSWTRILSPIMSRPMAVCPATQTPGAREKSTYKSQSESERPGLVGVAGFAITSRQAGRSDATTLPTTLSTTTRLWQTGATASLSTHFCNGQ